MGDTVRVHFNLVGGGFPCVMYSRSLFVVEGITVTDLLTNKISGSGSCLIGKL